MIERTFSEFMSQKRRELGLSLRQASALIGVSHSYLDKLEKMEAASVHLNPSPRVLQLIADAYDVEYTYLLATCGYIDSMRGEPLRIQNPDIMMISRAEKKFTTEQARTIRMYAQFMFPEAFADLPADDE